MRHRTLWIKPGDVLKGIVGSGVSEGVKQSHAAVELLLNGRRAGDGKRYSPEFRGRIVAMWLLRCCDGAEEEEQRQQGSPSISHPHLHGRVAFCASCYTGRAPSR